LLFNSDGTDDGPSVGQTNEVLDVLKRNSETATFFVCGQTYGDLNSTESEVLLKRMVAEVSTKIMEIKLSIKLTERLLKISNCSAIFAIKVL